MSDNDTVELVCNDAAWSLINILKDKNAKLQSDNQVMREALQAINKEASWITPISEPKTSKMYSNLISKVSKLSQQALDKVKGGV